MVRVPSWEVRTERFIVAVVFASTTNSRLKNVFGASNEATVVKVFFVIGIAVVGPLAQTPGVALKSTPASHRFKETMSFVGKFICNRKAGVERSPLF